MLKVALLPFDEFDLSTKCTIELRHQIEREGHSFFVLDKTLLDLDMDVGRVARTVGRTKADAWVLIGATQEVLEWFVEKEVPAFSLFGVHTAVPIAAGRPDKQAAFADFTRRLIRLGHTRISFVCRRHARKPQPSKNLCGYLGELEAAGIAAGDFNLPDWEESREGFAQVLDSLFRITPPTALIIEESYQYQAAYHQLSRMGFRVPEDVSLICTDSSPEFVWCKPSVSYVHWDYNPLVRRMVRWTNNVAKGRNDRRQFTTEARFFEGGSIGPALKDR